MGRVVQEKKNARKKRNKIKQSSLDRNEDHDKMRKFLKSQYSYLKRSCSQQEAFYFEEL